MVLQLVSLIAPQAIVDLADCLSFTASHAVAPSAIYVVVFAKVLRPLDFFTFCALVSLLVA